jgi:hypothetical protein
MFQHTGRGVLWVSLYIDKGRIDEIDATVVFIVVTDFDAPD